MRPRASRYFWPNTGSAVGTRTRTPHYTTGAYFDKTTPEGADGSEKSYGVLLPIRVGTRPCDTRSEFGGVLGSCIDGDTRTRTMRLQESQDEEKQFGSCGNDCERGRMFWSFNFIRPIVGQFLPVQVRAPCAHRGVVRLL